MFLDDLPSALERILALLAPGGRFAASVWPEAERVTCIRLPREVVLRVLDLPDCEEDGPGPFRLADSAALTLELRRAGFAELSEERVSCPMDFGSFPEFRGFLEDTSSSLAQALETRTPEAAARLWQELEREALVFADGEGRLRLPGEAILVSGRRPLSR